MIQHPSLFFLLLCICCTHGICNEPMLIRSSRNIDCEICFGIVQLLGSTRADLRTKQPTARILARPWSLRSRTALFVIPRCPGWAGARTLSNMCSASGEQGGEDETAHGKDPLSPSSLTDFPAYDGGRGGTAPSAFYLPPLRRSARVAGIAPLSAEDLTPALRARILRVLPFFLISCASYSAFLRSTLSRITSYCEIRSWLTPSTTFRRPRSPRILNITGA